MDLPPQQDTLSSSGKMPEALPSKQRRTFPAQQDGYEGQDVTPGISANKDSLT